MESTLAAGMEQFQTKEWTKILPIVQFNMNTSKPASTKIMPFQLVFNKMPNFGTSKEFLVMEKKNW